MNIPFLLHRRVKVWSRWERVTSVWQHTWSCSLTVRLSWSFLRTCHAQFSPYYMMLSHHMGFVLHAVIHAHRFTSGAWAQGRWLSTRLTCLPSWMHTMYAMVHLTGSIMRLKHVEFTLLLYITSVCAVRMLECMLFRTCMCSMKHR